MAKTSDESPWIMSPEEITQRLHTLSDELSMTPPQTGAVLQTTTEQLSNWRITGEGPPFIKMGPSPKSPIRYLLGEVRKWRAERMFANTSMANVCRFGSLGDFLSAGGIQDCYLAAIDESGDQWDFWESVRRELDIVEVRWMRMEDMLEGFRRQANGRHAQAEGDDVGAGIPDPKTPRKPRPF